jgi:hypothetical protein
VDSYDFTIMTNKKQRRQPLIPVQKCVLVPVVSNKERSNARLISRFSPKVTTADVEKSVK